VKVAGDCTRAQIRLSNPTAKHADPSRRPRTRSPALLEGFLSNVLNPKVAVFYLAFLPQFMRSGDWVFGKSMLLAAIHFVEGVIWMSTLTP